MGTMKTPGVYIVEKNAFPDSAVEVATAIPAFIGYTDKALNGNESLLDKPFRITSMAEFHAYFGGAPTPFFYACRTCRRRNAFTCMRYEKGGCEAVRCSFYPVLSNVDVLWKWGRTLLHCFCR